MNTVSLTSTYPGAPRTVVSGQWHRRVFRSGDLAGAIAVLIPVMLFANAVTGMRALEVAMYVVGFVAVLPCLPLFAATVQRSATGLLLVLLFAALTLSIAAAYYIEPSTDVWLRAKGLAGTAVWASIYVVIFVGIRTAEGANRLVKWLDGLCLAISASIWASALLHLVGVSFGEVIDQGVTTFRAFGPLGDQVSFVVVLPALTSLVARRPIRFGFHLSAVLLTGTRGALFCLLVGVAGYFLLRGRTDKGSIRGHHRQLAALATVATLLWFSPISAGLKERFQSPSMRIDAIAAGIEVVRESPVFGVGFNGLDSHRSAVAEDWTIPLQAANGLSRATNQYVQTAVDGGVVALVFLILFVSFTIRNAMRVMRWPAATPELFASQLWLIAILIGNQTSLWVLANTACGFFTFAIAGLAAKASDLSRDRRDTVDATSMRTRRVEA
jgi:O-antigen ligase